MKKLTALALASLALLGLLTACGGEKTNTPDVDLEAFYTGLEEKYGWTGNAETGGPDALVMADIEGELLENYYPRLSELAPKQIVLKMPMMSAAVNELAFVQCETEEDAAKAAEIFQARIDYQVGDETNPGGAWYPESIEGWKKAEVIQKGTYAALIASAEHQDEIVESFEQQFQ